MKATDKVDRGAAVEPRKFVFREAVSTEELVDLLRVRNAAFRSGPLNSFEAANRSGYHLDWYDPFADHFGLFLKADGHEHPVGYLRVIEERTEADQRILALARRSPTFSRALKPRPAPFPLMAYWPEGSAVMHAYRRLRAGRCRVVEASRFSLLTEFRSSNLAAFVVGAAVAVYFFGKRCDVAWLSGQSHHRGFYRRVGFRRTPGTTDRHLKEVPGNNCCLMARPEWVPSMLASTLRNMASQFQATGQIGHQACLPGRSTPVQACA